MSRHWIQTFTGQRFYPTEPDQNVMDIRDQARALSMICRYVGHVRKFYSVAEHAVRVSRLLERWMIEDGYPADTDENVTMCQWGLIHDNAEAYMGDLSAPVKGVPEVATVWKPIELRLERAIAEWLGLFPLTIPDKVVEADQFILGTEVRQLKSVPIDWHIAPEIPGLTLGWDPATAEKIYMQRFAKLFGNPEQWYVKQRTR